MCKHTGIVMCLVRTVRSQSNKVLHHVRYSASSYGRLQSRDVFHLFFLPSRVFYSPHKIDVEIGWQGLELWELLSPTMDSCAVSPGKCQPSPRVMRQCVVCINWLKNGLMELFFRNLDDATCILEYTLVLYCMRESWNLLTISQ